MQLQTRADRKMTPADAEVLAVAALSFLATDPDRLGTFLGETGLDPDSIRSAAGTPGFLPAVLDYLMSREDVLISFAADQGIDPATIAAARRSLPGARFIQT
jgi:hypothetical protein